MPSIDLTTLLSFALLVFAWWPGSTGRNRWTGRLLALVLLSPGLRYFSALFTFPIRLQLSTWAASLLRVLGMNVQAGGNSLINYSPATGPIEMSVDPACMGLQMTGISLLVGLFILIWHERETKKRVPFGWVCAFGISLFGLTIICNLFRIVLLVAFGAMPDTWAHEGIGLGCVAAYGWLPTWGLVRLLVQRTGRDDVVVEKSGATLTSMGWGVGLLAVGLSIMAFATHPNKPKNNLCNSAQMAASGWQKYGADCQCKTLSNGFVQLAKPGVLIYLKPQPDWFSADHSPTACWRGSGYELRRVHETMLDGHPAYVGELRKKNKVLFTAWWFSNGNINTTSQITMRWQMLRSELAFVLVNVTLDKEQTALFSK
ncbi:exosortase N [Spirosoma jeollabukense]